MDYYVVVAALLAVFRRQHTTTRSQAVARIADRTASQDSSNYNDCVIRPSILWVYQLNL